VVHRCRKSLVHRCCKLLVQYRMQNDNIYSRLRQHHYVHPSIGELRYAVMANTVYGPVVYRHLTALLPLDAHTFAVFAALRNAKPSF
jgi:hypothetical protein